MNFKRRLSAWCVLILATAITSQFVEAKLRLPKIVSSGMVLQQNSKVRIWGWAPSNAKVTIRCSWLDKEATTESSSSGIWEFTVTTKSAGGPHKIELRDSESTLKLDDILFGEVWLASGQSNMEMPLKPVSGAYTGIKDHAKEIQMADYPAIRLFQAGNFSSDKPLEDVQAGILMYGIPPAQCRWQKCSAKTVPVFASTAYFFARHLHRELKIPIGIIDSSWGGTSAEAWTPLKGLKKLGYQADVKRAATAKQKADQKIPTRLYNGMIHPLRRFTIKGVIWYQGEGNSGRADRYRQLFSTMINEWREAFDDEFPFYFVQISPFNYRNVNSAFLREAQLQTLAVKRTGMAVTMDIGNLTDIHPKNKQEVGRRLALWALKHDYGKSLVFSGPLYRSFMTQANQVRIQFDHADGLATSDGKAPSHFEVAGKDKVFHPATAAIDGSSVLISSPMVNAPVAVRYAFSNSAQPNLINKAKLPASSFRTDTWK